MKTANLVRFGVLAGITFATAIAATAQPTRVFEAPEKGKARPPLWVHGGKRAHPNSFNNNTTTPYTPQQVGAAYGFNVAHAQGLTGAGQTIAIVDAYDDSQLIQTDLNTFDSEFGLPAATVQVVYAAGSKPATNSGWQQEISLDVEWAHAVAPGAKIMLVEAASSSTASLLQAVQAAVNNGATVVSMSWGGNEFSGETGYDSYFTAKGVTFVASAGDSGAGVEWPAASPNVLGVGGTSLILNASGGYASETAWADSGGGISSLETAQPSWQSGWLQSAWTPTHRAVPDVGYLADPNYGVYVCYQGQWYEFGGTSVGAPQWSGLIALVNQARATNLGGANQVIYTLANGGATTSYGGHTVNAGYFNDVTSGTDGSAADDAAFTGYDLITGVGSPVADALIQALAGSTVTNTPPPPPTPSFALAVSPASQTVTAGAAASYTVTVTGSNNYSGTVNLAVSGLPTGATASFSAASIAKAGSSTVSVQTSASTPAGTYTVTITGTDSTGTPAHTATATLVVSAASSTIMTVSGVSYTASGFWNTTLNIALTVVNSAGQPVPNAAVSIALYYNNAKFANGTANTGSNGKVTFSLANAPAGNYSTVVTGVSAAGLTWTGAYPANGCTDPY